MQWPSWAIFWREDPDNDSISPQVEKTVKEALPTLPQSKHSTSWDTSLNRTDWSHYTTAQTITISIITTATTLALIRLYKTYLRRIPTVDYLKPGFFRRRSFYGFVTRVGDGDNFRLFHTPGGRLAGWGWLGRRSKKAMMERANAKGKEEGPQTMSVRIAGIDAPERAHFGRPAQPYSEEALEWLQGFVLEKWVRVYPYSEDQYKRVVASAYVRRFGIFRADVGLNMLKRGLATVYEAKSGSEFGGREEKYKATEERAKRKQVGMWSEPGILQKLMGKKSEEKESPREYKNRMKKEDKS